METAVHKMETAVHELQAIPAAPYDARAVANFVLDLADHRGVALTQMALLKILYFAHGWYLAKADSPLLLQDFEAWQHGPVVKVVRDEFAKYGQSPIVGRATKFVVEAATALFQILNEQPMSHHLRRSFRRGTPEGSRYVEYI